MIKLIAKITILSMVFAMFAYMSPSPVQASGVTLYIDLTADSNYNDGLADNGGLDDLGTISTEPEMATSSSDEVYFSFASGAQFANTDTLTINLPANWSGADCTTATTDADADGTLDGGFAFSSNVATYTFSAATTAATTTGVEFCISVSTNATAGNQVVTLVDDQDNTGAGFIYSGDDNDVSVSATVNENLYFAIRNSADTSDTNACALGTLDTSTVSTCEYRIALETTAANGVDVYIQDTSSNSGLTANAGANDIDAVTEDDTVTAGDEEYGIALTAATSGGTVSESGDFNDDDTPIPTSKTQILDFTGTFDYTQGTTATSSLVTHRAAIDATTVAGSYTQTVSYYATANF